MLDNIFVKVVVQALNYHMILMFLTVLSMVSLLKIKDNQPLGIEELRLLPEKGGVTELIRKETGKPYYLYYINLNSSTRISRVGVIE